MRVDLDEGRDATLDVRLHERLEVVVRGAMAGGYEWNAEVDGARCRLVSREPTGQPATSFGAPQREVIVFEPVKTGITTVVLRLQRPWEDTPVRTAAIELRVSEGADG